MATIDPRLLALSSAPVIQADTTSAADTDDEQVALHPRSRTNAASNGRDGARKQTESESARAVPHEYINRHVQHHSVPSPIWNHAHFVTNEWLPSESFNAVNLWTPSTGVDFSISTINPLAASDHESFSGGRSHAAGPEGFCYDALQDWQGSFNNPVCSYLDGFAFCNAEQAGPREVQAELLFNHDSIPSSEPREPIDYQQLPKDTSISDADNSNATPDITKQICHVDLDSGTSLLSNTPMLMMRRSSEPEAPASKKRALAIRSPQTLPSGRPLVSLAAGPQRDNPSQPRRYTIASDAVTLFGRRSPELTFTQEQFPSGGSGRLKDVKGRRKGPLSTETRVRAKKTRQLKLVCIRCKKDRQACGGNPCIRCVALGTSTAWPQPCTKAHFLDLIESGTCNYISQRAINHKTMDGNRRIRINLPEVFDLDQVLKNIDSRRHQFNIRVRQAGQSIYVLDLDNCYRYLSSIHKQQTKSKHDLRGFIDQGILKAGDWKRCVTECDPTKELMGLLSVWNNMPSRASYYYVPVEQSCLPGGLHDQPMNVEDPVDRANIMLAAQLSRIVCRKLEVEAYSSLQSLVNHWNDWMCHHPEDGVKFVRELGVILGTLRWRVSWWHLLGDGGKAPDAGKERFEDRVNNLCRILYFYYCRMRSRIPSYSDKKGLYGTWSNYADTSLPVFDDFPDEESIEGFEAWMLRGRELIVTAGVAGKLVGIGLKTA